MRLSTIACLLAFAAAPALAEPFETRLAPSPATEGTRGNVTGEGRGLHHPNNGNALFVFALPDN